MSIAWWHRFSAPTTWRGRCVSSAYRRRAGSRPAWWRASTSAETFAYLASDRTEVWPERPISQVLLLRVICRYRTSQ